MCGFVGLIGIEPAAPALALGLQALQHRGQDAAGLGIHDGRRFRLTKDMGMVTQALPPATVNAMGGRAGVAHVRYPTAGGNATREDAQPFLTRIPGVLLAHNGNVTNTDELIEDLASDGMHVLSECDAEPILLVFTRGLLSRRPSKHTTDDVLHAIQHVFDHVRGGYTVTALLEVDDEMTLVAFRDPHGIRPGVYGTREDGAWMVASESVALDVLGFSLEGQIPPGTAITMRKDQTPMILPVLPKAPKSCIFERIYFARPDSIMEDGRVNRTRWLMGRQLAREWREKGFEADVVIAVPDTSRPAAMAMADELGVHNREGFIKNRYSGRTFIMPDEATRKAALRLKLNPIKEMFEGKRVLLVDDSIVRGATMARIVEMIRDLEPKEVHLAIFSPPVAHPCFYGIDMPSHEELVAAQHEPADLERVLAEELGADSLTYLSLEGLLKVSGDEMCAACFDGDYIVPITDDERERINADRRP